MIFNVFRFELEYWFKRPLTLVFFALFFLLAFFTSASDAFLNVGGSGQTHRNAPFALALAIAILTAIGQVITTAVAGTAVVRDSQLGTEELLFTTQLSKSAYLVGRFAGAFVVMVAIYAALPLGLFLGLMMPWIEPDKLGPIRFWDVLQPFLVIAIPNLLFVSGLFFAVGALTRKLFAVYVTGIVLLVVYSITQRIVGNLDNLTLSALIDPFGISSVNLTSRYWSIAEKNTLLIPLAGIVLRNRLLWGAAGLALFALVCIVFRLRLHQRSASRRVQRAAAAQQKSAVVKLPVPIVAMRDDLAGWIGVAWRQATFHVRSIVREPAFMAITVICLVNAMMGAWYSSHPQDSVMWPVTFVIASGAANSVTLFLVLLATLYGGELVWRERQIKVDQIQDTMPVPPWVLYTGKLAGLFMALIIVIALTGVATAVMQVAQGYTRLQPLLYLGILAATAVPYALAIVVFAGAVHAVVNQKFVGHLIVIAYWIGLTVASQLGVVYSLFHVADTATWTYSDLNGWGSYLPRIMTFNGYSIAVALILAAAGYLVLARGTDSRWASRVAEGRRRWRGGGRVAIGTLAVCAAAFAAIYYYNANVLNVYSGVRPAERMLADWERTYKPLRALPQPHTVAVTLRNDIAPEHRSASWTGTILAVNRDSRAIDTLFVSVPPSVAIPADRYTASGDKGIRLDSLGFNRQAQLILDDTRRGVRLYRLSPVLAPGDTLSMRFAGGLTVRGFPDGNFNNDVTYNGTFMNNSYVPGFGYREDNELSDDDVRRRNGFGVKDRMKKLDDPAMRQTNYITSDADWIAFDETACTAPDQVAIAPGYLQREWVENGRRCFHYVMDQPVLDFFATLSARYAVSQEGHNGVKLEIYHLPEHAFALQSMLQASKDGLDYYSANFSPYQYRQYRIIEFPGYQTFAQSFPNTIPYSEAVGFLYRNDPGDDKIDFAYFVTAHELAHQWWGHQVVGGNGQGSTMFSEGLAEYSALTVMEKRYGPEAAQKFLRRELDGYLRGRGVERKKEVPLLYVENQPYIHYQKGSLVFYALRDYIGESAMNSALHAFLAKWAFKGPPYPNSRDLYAEFDRVTPDSLKYVLHDLFEEMTFYDNKADSAVASKRSDGKWNVHLVLKARKLKGDSLGNTAEVPIADYIDVGIFGEHVAGQKLGARLFVQKVHITQNITTLDFVVDKEPKQAGIDPYNKLIDRTPQDNVMAVRIGP